MQCRYCNNTADHYDEETGWHYCESDWYVFLDEYEAWKEYG